MVESVVTQMMSCYSEAEKAAVYRVIRERRDVRMGYLPQPLHERTLTRLLSAAHTAPSVGFMQPWRFIVVRNTELRTAVHDNFVRANAEATSSYSHERRAAYGRLKLEGLLEAPQHLCVVCDTNTARGHGLGRNSMPQTATYSVACAIQNLWLAARAEGVGVGWVSILDPLAIKTLLHIPLHVELVAYLCVGYVASFSDVPDLERNGWEKREELASLVRSDYFDNPYSFEEVSQ
ncbi:MAG TPA: 5,6-dimethylbenzimidazole synthase [Terracidiphilus sp.]|nr:5,6-dimethylbenzimidazole synthase [Terracidiphilus sp.]